MRNKDDKVKAKYKIINLNPENLDEKYIADEVNIGDELYLGDSNLGKTKFKVANYELSEKFEVGFKYNIGNNEYNGIKVISPNIIGKSEKVIIKLDSLLDIDETLSLKKYIKNSAHFINFFGKIKYNINGTYKYTSLTVINYSFLNDNNVFIEVPKEVKDAENIELVLNIRNISYGIILK